ncbi:MAG TPA: sterol desaturase family protein [Polyangiaceae bacterium]
MPTLHSWSVPLFVLAAALVMMIAERRWPGRAWPKVVGWWPRALALNAVQAGSVFLAGVLWEPWLRAHRLWSAESLGPALGVTVGYLVHTFVYYWWHRARHRVPVLWRWVHQVHHSPERIEVITSFYKHPIEILTNGVLSSLVLYIGVGLDPIAASATMLVNGFAELVYHWNVRTPRWLGYIVQRPESHLVHHQHGLHHYNYADLPIFDILFGTFKNPERWEARCGLGPQQEHRLIEMLAGKDIGSVPVERNP